MVPSQAFDFLVLAWHHAHLVYQSQSKQKRYQQRERQEWLACAEGLLGEEFATLKAWVFDQLDSIRRASSLVAMVNAFIRPSRNSGKGQITPEALNLLMFSHNQHRYKSGKRQGKAPRDLLTGKPLQAEWWELVTQPVKREEASKDTCALPSRPLRQLMANND